jgi:outer membrane protein TolC
LNLISQQHVNNNKYLPQVNLLGSTGINASDIRRIPHNVGLSAGVHVAIPISDGHQRKIYQKQNDILLANQQILMENAAMLQQNNLRNAKQQIDQWNRTIEMGKEPIQKQELLLEIIKEKVIKGQVTVMDYINALQQYALLQKNQAIAETNVLLYINQYNYYNW